MPSPSAATSSAPPARLLDQVRERIRYLHYSIRTEDAYVHWIRGYVRFHQMRHPRGLGVDAVRAYLSWLALHQRVSVSTHRQAQSALLFLYRQVLGDELPWMADLERPQVKRRLPVVLSVDEVRAVLGLMEGTHGLLARLLYGTGLRITEALQLRTKDVDFDRQVLVEIGTRFARVPARFAATTCSMRPSSVPSSAPLIRPEVAGGAVRSPLDALAA